MLPSGCITLASEMCTWWLWSCAYRRQGMALHSSGLKGSHKKVYLWKGPYTIIDKFGEVNYKIQLIGGIQCWWFIETGWSYAILYRSCNLIMYLSSNLKQFLINISFLLTVMWQETICYKQHLSLLINCTWNIVTLLWHSHSSVSLDTLSLSYLFCFVVVIFNYSCIVLVLVVVFML